MTFSIFSDVSIIIGIFTEKNPIDYYSIIEIFTGKNPIIWRMRKQSIAGILSKASEGG